MNARNPRWSDASHTSITMEIDHPDYGWIPFAAHPLDVEPHGRELYARAVAGEFGPVQEYTPPPKTREQRIAEIEAQRDALLAAGFWFNGQLFHADPIFQSQLQAFLLAWNIGLLDAAATVAIRRKDDVTVQMGRAEVTALAAALMQHVQGIYAQSWAAKDALQ